MTIWNQVVGYISCDAENCEEYTSMEGMEGAALLAYLSRNEEPRTGRWAILPPVRDRSLPWFLRFGQRVLCPAHAPVVPEPEPVVFAPGTWVFSTEVAGRGVRVNVVTAPEPLEYSAGGVITSGDGPFTPDQLIY